MGVARWNMHNVSVASTGSGLKLAGTWVWEIVSCVISGCGAHGIEIVLSHDGNSSATAGRIVGGEIQGNGGYGVYAESVSGIFFLGTSIEGNHSGGVNLANNCRNVGFFNAYFELNGRDDFARDIVAGDIFFGGTKITGYSLQCLNCVFWNGAGASRNYSVELSRMRTAVFIGCQFNGYGVGGINNNPESGGTVDGYYRACKAPGGSVATDLGYFEADWSDAAILSTQTIDFPGIPAGSSVSHDFTISGATQGDFVMVSSGANLQGLALSAYVTGPNTVRVVLNNNTTSTVDIPDSTWRIMVIPKSLFF